MIQFSSADPRALIGVALCLSMFAFGCSRGGDTEGGSGASQTNVAVSNAPVEAQALEVAPDASPQAVLAELNRELRKWVLRNRRTPSSFEEFAAQLQVPPPPAGKRYVLTKQMRIELVNK